MGRTEIVSVIPDVPITVLRPPPNVDKLAEVLYDAGQPRANRAPTVEKPEGTEDSPDNRTVLQQHVDFFDRDNDGLIYPIDTYIGFRRIGFGRFISFLAMPFIHGTFSYPSQNTWLPDPLFSINTENMHRTKHGSDSETYDTEGRYVPQKFEEFFSKHDKEGKGSLTFKQIWSATETNRNVFDPTGWTAEKLEWVITWWLLKDEHGRLTKEKARACIDGSIWYQLAAENEHRQVNGRKPGKMAPVKDLKPSADASANDTGDSLNPLAPSSTLASRKAARTGGKQSDQGGMRAIFYVVSILAVLIALWFRGSN